MDFRAVLRLIIGGFNANSVRYGLIGGFAMGVWGVPRATVDVDFLVDKRDIEKVDGIMKGSGYACVHKSENVSQYVSPLAVFGEVDFLHAFRQISTGMLARAAEKEVFEGELKIKVLQPEDIIGLKVQAMVNNKERIARECLDIESLMAFYGKKLNWNLVEEYFSLFDLANKFSEWKAKYGNIER